MNQRHTSVTVSPISCLAYKCGKLDATSSVSDVLARDGWIEELQFFLTLPASIPGNVPTIQVMFKEVMLSQVVSKGRQAHCSIAPMK